MTIWKLGTYKSTTRKWIIEGDRELNIRGIVPALSVTLNIIGTKPVKESKLKNGRRAVVDKSRP